MLVLVLGFSLGKLHYECSSLTIASVKKERLHADILNFNRLFYIALLSIRIVAVSRSRSWGQTSICNSGKRTSIFPEGEYTLQFTLKGLKKAVPKASAGDGSMRGQSGLGDEQQLIDT